MIETPEFIPLLPPDATEKAIADGAEFTKLIEKCDKLKRILSPSLNNNKTENFNKIKNMLCEISVEMYEFQSRPSFEKWDTEPFKAKIEAVEFLFYHATIMTHLTLMVVMVDLTKKLDLFTRVIVSLTMITIIITLITYFL